MIFESFYFKGNNSLNQIVLSYIEQFNIFEKCLNEQKDYKSLNDLFLNSINDLSKGKIKQLDYQFLLFLFIRIYNLYLNRPDGLIKNTIIKYFEELNFNLLENEINKLYNSNNPNTPNIYLKMKLINYIIQKI